MSRSFVTRWFSPAGACMMAVVTLAIEPLPSHGQGKHTKEDILKAWKERQERVRSARFEWAEQQTETRGSLSYYWKKFDRSVRDIVPPRDVTFTDPRELSLDGNKLRYGYTRRHWSQLKGGYERQSYLSVFNGETCALLNGPTTERGWHEGQIRSESFHVECMNLHLQPILMTFRALTPRMRAYDIDGFDMTGANIRIGNSACLELSQGPSGGVESRLWVDPARAFVVVRCMTLRSGIVWHKLDIHYTPGAGGEWVPDRWSIVFNKPDGTGQLESSFQARVTSYALNDTIPSGDFELNFPPGTRVIDEKRNLHRTISPGSSDNSVNWPALGGVVLALTGLAVVFLWRRRPTKGRITCSGT